MSDISHVADELWVRKMNEAQASQRGLEYAEACDMLGISEEEIDTPLYQSGLAERAYLDEIAESVARPETKYQKFYRRGILLSSSFGKDTEEKKGLMKECFPGKYRQMVKRELDSVQVGAAFERMLKYSEKRTQQNS